MYWTRTPKRSDLENGTVFAHGSTRLNLAPADLTNFVDPADAALCFGFRALAAGDGFDKSFAVWMATLRRRGGNDAVVESLQRIFPALVDDKSLEHLLGGIVARARELGYERVWMVPALFQEPLLAPALKAVTDAVGSPLVVVPTSGMAAIELGPRRVEAPEAARQRALAALGVEYQKAYALRNDRYWDHGRGNAQLWVSIAYDVAAQWLRAVAPLPAEPSGAYLGRVAAHVREARGKGPPEDDESWFDGAIDEAARLISGAGDAGAAAHADRSDVGARASFTAPEGAPYRAPEPGGTGVFLEAHGPDKIQVIKAVIDHTRCGLKEAKELVESAPSVGGAGLDATTTAHLRAALVAAGARVR